MTVTETDPVLGGRPARQIVTGEDYVESLRGRDLRVHYLGERVEEPVDHPVVRPSVNAMARTYDLAVEHPDLATAYSSISGRAVNRFLHVAQSADGVVMLNKMQRRLGQDTGTCFQRCVGMDAFNALFSVTYECDQARGTSYHERLRSFLRHCQEGNLVVGRGDDRPQGRQGQGSGSPARPGPVHPGGRAPRGRRGHPRGQGAPDGVPEQPLDHRHAHDADDRGRPRLRGGRRDTGRAPRADLRARMPVLRHPVDGGWGHRRRQRPLRRAGGDEVWIGQVLKGGQAWWEEILAQIRGYPASLDSRACARERDHAAPLRASDAGAPSRPAVRAADGRGSASQPLSRPRSQLSSPAG